MNAQRIEAMLTNFKELCEEVMFGDPHTALSKALHDIETVKHDLEALALPPPPETDTKAVDEAEERGALWALQSGYANPNWVGEKGMTMEDVMEIAAENICKHRKALASLPPQQGLSTQVSGVSPEALEPGVGRDSPERKPTPGPVCSECYGVGLTSNHVTGEVECGTGNGTGKPDTMGKGEA